MNYQDLTEDIKTPEQAASQITVLEAMAQARVEKEEQYREWIERLKQDFPGVLKLL